MRGCKRRLRLPAGVWLVRALTALQHDERVGRHIRRVELVQQPGAVLGVQRHRHPQRALALPVRTDVLQGAPGRQPAGCHRLRLVQRPPPEGQALVSRHAILVRDLLAHDRDRVLRADLDLERNARGGLHGDVHWMPAA